MNIDLNFLVKYFTTGCSVTQNKFKSNDKFNLDIFQSYNSQNFSKFNNIFENFIDRIGVCHFDNNKNNISLLFSIIHCLDDNFCTFEKSKQNYIILKTKEKIYNDVISRKIKFPKKVSKDIIISRMKSNNIESIDLYIYSLFFKINIFVFDFIENKIKLYYPENEFIPFKPNLFLSKNKILYQPLVYRNSFSKLFKYNSSIIEYILYKCEFELFNFDNEYKNNKKFKICNDYDLILKNYKNKDLKNIIINKKVKENELIDSTEEESDFNIPNEEDISNEIHDNKSSNTDLINELKQFTDSKLKKLKKNQLLEYLNKLTNKINNKKITKSKIINKIKKYIE